MLMKRVITYGSFDLLHYGHIELLRRAKAIATAASVSDAPLSIRATSLIRSPVVSRRIRVNVS